MKYYDNEDLKDNWNALLWCICNGEIWEEMGSKGRKVTKMSGVTVDEAIKMFSLQ